MHTRVTRKEEVASHFCCCQRLNRSQDYLSIQHCKCGSCSISMGLLVIRAVFWTVTLLPGLALQQTAVPGSVSTIPKDVPKMSSIPKNSLPGATQEAMSVADGGTTPGAESVVNQFNPSPIRQPVSPPLANPTWWLLSPHQVPNQNSLPNQGSAPKSLQSASNISHPPYQYSPPFIITIIQPSKGISASPQDPQAAIASPQTIPTTVAPPQLPQGTNPQPYTLQVMYQPIPLPQVVYQAPQYNPASLFAPPVVYYLPPPSMVVEPTVLSPANRNQGLAGHRNTVSTSGSSTLPKSPGGSSAPQTSSFASKIRNSSSRAPASTRTSDRSTPAPASKGRGNQGNSATSFRNVFLSQLLQPAAQQMARASGVAQYYEAHGCLDPPAVHALALTRGCTSSHAQRACEAIGHVGAEGMVHSPALSHLMSVMFPPVTSARLEACLSMTTIRQVTTQAMKSGRMGFSPLSTMIRTLAERMRARTRAVPSGNNSTHNAGVGVTGQARGQARGQDDVCEHVVSMLAMRAGVTPTSLEGIMEAVRDLRRHTMPYKCQEGKVGAMPFRMCCPGHVDSPTLMDLAFSTPA